MSAAPVAAVARIVAVAGREILDSRGNPTVEAEVVLGGGARGRAAVPSGASTGSREALELRDGERNRYAGRGVRRAVGHIRTVLAPALCGLEATAQQELDRRMLELDGTENKARLGANAILAVSLAAARAAAAALELPLYTYLARLAGRDGHLLPVPLMNILNGGVHADNAVDFQEFLIVPSKAPNFTEALRMGVEVFYSLKALLKTRGYSVAVGDEGGFAPQVRSNREALELVLAAIENAGYRPGAEVALALDPAASEFYDPAERRYVLRKSGEGAFSPEQMVALWEDWVRQYPIVSLEDGLAEQDTEGWRALTAALGKKIQLIGDDNFVTNPRLLEQGIQDGVANAVLIKPNQIGTLTETLACVRLAHTHGYRAVISHRSGETEDSFIADLAVGLEVGQIKTGAPCRGERTAKYNQLVRIEEELGARARFAGPQLFGAPGG